MLICASHCVVRTPPVQESTLTLMMGCATLQKRAPGVGNYNLNLDLILLHKSNVAE